ncbi:ABC transporter substrate-binding protein [Acidovorax sp. HMWF029]|uniref:ABC transporter substrate-binding protein n=1 Tax=Acidovorax sp. HMWF029 TaxID=2056863 RepID=UPI000D33B44C|nr:ABC transporter substrate-binding protein [Acidovorax sp. HMWF029]PTT18961.1 ABC transporter substrate-binding protein [Acidovorax sp. HMWF029]
MRLTHFLGRTLVALSIFSSSTLVFSQGIVLGQIGPFTVLPAPDAVQVNEGIKAYVAQANKTGIKGQKITLFEVDDRYSAEGFLEQFPKAMEKKPIALISPIGSAAIKRMLDDKLLDSASVVVMNAVPGAESLRTPGHAKLFHIRAGDKQQIERIVAHSRTLGMSRLSVLHQDLPIGISGMAMAQEAASATAGMELQGVKSATEPAALAAAAQQVGKIGAQGVLVVGAPRFMAEGIAALRKAGVSQSIFALSYVPAGLIVKLAGEQGARGVGIAQTFPNPNGKTLPLHREFHAAMKEAFPQLQEYTSFHLEGYLSARTVGEALKRSKDTNLTAASLASTLSSMGEVDFGGFRVDFSKGNVGSRFVDIAVIGSDGRLRY